MTRLVFVLLALAPAARAEERRGGAAPVTALAFSPDGQTVLAGSQAGIEARRWPDLEIERRLETSLGHVHDLRFSPDGRWLAAAGGEPASEGRIEVWSWPVATRAYTRVAHEDLVYGLAWSPDSKHLASASYDRTVGVLVAATGEVLRKLSGHSRAVLAVSYSGDGTTLVSAGVDLSLRVWDAATGERRRVLDNHTAPVLGLASRPASPSETLSMVASVSDDLTVRFWQPGIGRLVRFARLPSRPLAVDWLASGDFVVAACEDGHVRVVDPDTAKVVEDVRALRAGWAYSVAVSPRSGAAVVGGDKGKVVRLELGNHHLPDRAEQATE